MGVLASTGEVFFKTAESSFSITIVVPLAGTYQVALKIANEHIVGSPATIQLTSLAAQLSKTQVEGDGLHTAVAGLASRLTLRFYDEFDNPAVPGAKVAFGFALQQGRNVKDLETHAFEMRCVDEAACVYEVAFTAQKDGPFDLHIWADDSAAPNGKTERVPLGGSPSVTVKRSWGF